MNKSVEMCVPKEKCCGCGACINVCPTNALMYGLDEDGFIVPVIDRQKCINCGKCTRICPIINIVFNSPLHAYAGVNRNKEVLLQSSSGGVFSEIAKNVLKENGVVYGCTLKDNFRVSHIRIDSVEELKKITKSKYVQSDMHSIYKEIADDLLNERKVLFCGTPCQVSAVKNYIGNRNSERLILVDIVCHGVPSQTLFDDYIDNLEQKNKKKPENYYFRHKIKADNGMDWYSGYRFEGSPKVKVKNWPEDSFNYLYMTSVTCRESCYQCEYSKVERVGDFTLCDYWGWEKYHKNDFLQGDSVSAILVNTEKGIKYFEEIVKNGNLYVIETETENVCANNGCLRTPVQRNPCREEVLALWKEQGYQAVDKWFVKRCRKRIVKYAIMRHMPKKLIVGIRGFIRR